jgi:hypothetical protein
MPSDISERLQGALSDGGEKKKGKPHVHSVNYERADNGGFHATVEKRHKDGTHHSTEHHVLMSKKDAAAHLLENMGNQPDAGAPPPGADDQPPEDAAAPDQGGAPPPGGVPGAGAAPPGIPGA